MFGIRGMSRMQAVIAAYITCKGKVEQDGSGSMFHARAARWLGAQLMCVSISILCLHSAGDIKHRAPCSCPVTMLTTACTLVSVALALAAPQQLPSIPGAAGRDYPALTSPPRTAFTCSGLKPGYYADPEGGCQVTSWHLVSASLSGHNNDTKMDKH